MRNRGGLLPRDAEICGLLVQPVAVGRLRFRRVHEVEPRHNLPARIASDDVKAVPIIPAIRLPLAMFYLLEGLWLSQGGERSD